MSDTQHSRLTRTSTGQTGYTHATGRTRSTGSQKATTLVVAASRLRRRAAAIWSRARRWLSETITPAGWLLATIAIAGCVAGLWFGWVEALAAGLVALVLLVAAIPFLFSARAYDVALVLERDRVVAGTEVGGTLTVVNIGTGIALPGRVDVPVGDGLLDVHVPLLRRGGSYEERIVVPTARRGVITIGPARAVRGDPLGILRREASWSDEHTLFIHPQTTALPSTSGGFLRDLEGNPSTRIVNADISFHAIREYAPGDAQRQVHWKSTAKTGTLMVRQYEETRRSRMVIVIARADDEFGTDDEVELAVSAAGSLGVRALRDGRDVSVVTGGELPEFARLRVHTTRELPTVSSRTFLDALAGLETGERVTRVRDVATLATESHPDASVALIVCGGVVTARELQQAALAFPADVAVVAVICNPESEPGLRRLGDVAVLTIGILDDLRHLLARGAAS